MSVTAANTHTHKHLGGQKGVCAMLWQEKLKRRRGWVLQFRWSPYTTHRGKSSETELNDQGVSWTWFSVSKMFLFFKETKHFEFRFFKHLCWIAACMYANVNARCNLNFMCFCPIPVDELHVNPLRASSIVVWCLICFFLIALAPVVISSPRSSNLIPSYSHSVSSTLSRFLPLNP